MTFGNFNRNIRLWDWVHPSHRDLVIDQLSASPEMSAHYLKHGGVAAISLALSQGGGASGERKFPLLMDRGSWEILAEACFASIRENPQQNSTSIFTVLESATSTSVSTDVRELVFRVCSTVKEYWDRERIVFSASLIIRFLKLCEKTGRYINSPSLKASWDAACSRMKKEAQEAKEYPTSLAIDSLDHWILFVQVISTTEPRLIPKGSLEDRFDEAIALYVDAFKGLLEEEFSDEDLDKYQDESERLSEIAGTVESLIPLFPSRQQELVILSQKSGEKAITLEDEAEELKGELGLVEPDYDRDGPSRSESSFDVNSLFEDL